MTLLTPKQLIEQSKLNKSKNCNPEKIMIKLKKKLLN